jgi:hypothetical protein
MSYKVALCRRSRVFFTGSSTGNNTWQIILPVCLNDRLLLKPLKPNKMENKNPKSKFTLYNSKLERLNAEPVLLLNENAMAEIDGDNDIIAAGTYISIKDNPVKCLDPIVIGADQLLDLYLEASSMYKKDTDILALKIIFGAENESFHFVFQPVCLGQIGEGYEAHGVKQGLFQIFASDFCREFNKEFTPLDDPFPYQAYYQSEVKIARKKGKPLGHFILGHDTEYAIITFQEIFTLLKDNSNSVNLNIYNCIRRRYTNEDLDFRHSLIFASGNMGPNFADPVFENKYANLIHLCPPSCTGLMLALVGKE